MSKWSQKRQSTIIIIFAIIILGVFGYLGFTFLYKPPTCTDGIKNQNEGDIDCGGVCTNLCTQDTFNPIVKWQRIFPVIEGIYTATVAIENQNFNAIAEKIPYKIKVFNNEGIVIYERLGFTTLEPRSTKYIVETRINIFEQKPSRIAFEFTEPIKWQKKVGEENTTVFIDQINTEGQAVGVGYKVSARVNNKDVRPIPKVIVNAILFDDKDNAMGASQTVIEGIPAGGFKNAIFTWPVPFEKNVSRVDIKSDFQI